MGLKIIDLGLVDFNAAWHKQREGLSGVWIGKRKIASIGISVKNWISFHGLSINIKGDDLSNFSLIRPCAMDIIVTSLESETKGGFRPEGLQPAIVKFINSGLFKL